MSFTVSKKLGTRSLENRTVSTECNRWQPATCQATAEPWESTATFGRHIQGKSYVSLYCKNLEGGVISHFLWSLVVDVLLHFSLRQWIRCRKYAEIFHRKIRTHSLWHCIKSIMTNKKVCQVGTQHAFDQSGHDSFHQENSPAGMRNITLNAVVVNIISTLNPYRRNLWRRPLPDLRSL